MSLSFSFQLTPLQTKMLLICAYGHYTEIGVVTHGKPPDYLPDFQCGHFVTVGKKLQEKGLLSWDGKRNPTWLPTDAGMAMAAMIVADARKIIEYADTAKPIPGAKAKKKSSGGV